MNISKIVKLMIGVFFCVASVVSSAQSIENMKLQGLKGNKDTTFKALQGNYVYLDFGASWCGPCKKSFPFMVELQNTFKNENFKIVAVSVDEEKSDAIEFLNDNVTNFAVYLDAESVIATKFDLPGMPTSYLIDPTGKIVSKHVGFNQKSKATILAELNTIFNRK